MPNTVKTTAEGTAYADPFVGGPGHHTDQVKLDISTLSSGEVDTQGYLKPGLPLKYDGAIATPVGAAETAHGVVRYPVKVAEDNDAATLAAAVDIEIVLSTMGQVSRKVCEDNLGRVLTADEASGFDGSHLNLVA